MTAKSPCARRVEVGHSILAWAHQLETRAATPASSQQMAHQALQTVRYRATSTWLQTPLDARVVMPLPPDLNGSGTDRPSKTRGRPSCAVCPARTKGDGGGLVEYQWPKPGQDKPAPKIAREGFAPWGWVLAQACMPMT